MTLSYTFHSSYLVHMDLCSGAPRYESWSCFHQRLSKACVNTLQNPTVLCAVSAKAVPVRRTLYQELCQHKNGVKQAMHHTELCALSAPPVLDKA